MRSRKTQAPPPLNLRAPHCGLAKAAIMPTNAPLENVAETIATCRKRPRRPASPIPNPTSSKPPTRLITTITPVRSVHPSLQPNTTAAPIAKGDVMEAETHHRDQNPGSTLVAGMSAAEESSESGTTTNLPYRSDWNQQ